MKMNEEMSDLPINHQAILSLVFGVISLNGIRRRNESGSPMAWIGIVLGGLIFLCVMCMIAAIASFFIFTPDAVPMPPFIQNFSI